MKVIHFFETLVNFVDTIPEAVRVCQNHRSSKCYNEELPLSLPVRLRNPFKVSPSFGRKYHLHLRYRRYTKWETLKMEATFPLKRRLTFNGPHCVRSQKKELVISIATENHSSYTVPGGAEANSDSATVAGSRLHECVTLDRARFVFLPGANICYDCVYRGTLRNSSKVRSSSIGERDVVPCSQSRTAPCCKTLAALFAGLLAT